MIPNRTRRAVLLAAIQAGDAAATVKPIAFIAADWDRLGVSEQVRSAIPPLKAAASVGLLVGTKAPRLGRFTARCLVAYFLVAIGYHVRAGDPVGRSLPAVAMGIVSALTVGDFARDIATEPSGRTVRKIERRALRQAVA